MPFQYTSSSVVQADSQTDVEIECPLGILILVTPILASFIGCLAYPYLPCVRSKFCFYDAASIHQADPVLMRRGIYGIGGFLRVLLWFVTTWPLIAVLHLSRNCLCEKNQLLRMLGIWLNLTFTRHTACWTRMSSSCIKRSKNGMGARKHGGRREYDDVEIWVAEESFNRYVRGPMRQELLEYDVRLSLPLPYYAQVLWPFGLHF
eukprot:g12493.t1